MKCCKVDCNKEATKEMYDKAKPYHETYNFYCSECADECKTENDEIISLGS